ncbi:MAG TPA: hypothetical protein VN030_05165 [Cellvibrio sp.]|nr:hypothetical protein [Cellvibrio sp.]
MKLRQCGLLFSTLALSVLAQADGLGYSCEQSNLAAAKTELTKSSKKQLPDAIARAEDFLQRCKNSVLPPAATSTQAGDYYGLVNQLMAAHSKTENIPACITLGTVATSLWNSPYKTLQGSPVYQDLQKTFDSCKTKREKKLGEKFSAEPCPLFGAGHKYSSAVKAPPQWQLTAKGTACLYLHPGKNRAIPEEEGIRLRENSPYLILLTKEGDDVYERFIDFQQGSLASKDLCLSGRMDNIDFLATAGKKNNPLIRIRSYAEHCLRDSAAFAIDFVYKIDTEGLVATDELSITLQP